MDACFESLFQGSYFGDLKKDLEEGMMQLTSDDIFIQSCAPWGNLCVSWGTKYVPIGVPSILASLLLFVPLFVALAKIRELEKENFRLKDEMEEAYKQRER